MIDLELRDMQITRVLGFLDEQLGDNDVTIVFGDAADGLVYFVSNRALPGYQKMSGIYVKDAGKPKQWPKDARESIKTHTSLGSRYYHEKPAKPNRLTIELSPSQLYVIGTTSPYAWNYSAAFRDLVAPKHESSHLLFPDDQPICHDGAHGILIHHNDFLAKYKSEPLDKMMGLHLAEFPLELVKGTRGHGLNEAAATFVSSIYMDRFYPENSGKLREFLEFLKLYSEDVTSMTASGMVLEQPEILEEIRHQIRERNLARKAAEEQAQRPA